AMTSGDYNKDGRPDMAIFSIGGNTTTLQGMLNETKFLGPIPELTWIRAGTLTRLVWYTNYPNFALEYRPTLSPPDAWAGAQGPLLTIDCQNFYTIASNRAGFYRLRKP